MLSPVPKWKIFVQADLDLSVQAPTYSSYSQKGKAAYKIGCPCIVLAEALEIEPRDGKQNYLSGSIPGEGS